MCWGLDTGWNHTFGECWLRHTKDPAKPTFEQRGKYAQFVPGPARLSGAPRWTIAVMVAGTVSASADGVVLSCSVIDLFFG